MTREEKIYKLVYSVLYPNGQIIIDVGLGDLTFKQLAERLLGKEKAKKSVDRLGR